MSYKKNFVDFLLYPLKEIYTFFSVYPAWVGQVAVGIVSGLFIGLFCRFFGKQFLYMAVASGLVIWILWYLKIVVLCPSVLNTLLGIKAKNIHEFSVILKDFCSFYSLEVAVALLTALFVTRWNS